MPGAPFPPAVADLHRAREWLVADQLGGFAMGSFTGVNHRRYHALFIAALAPPVRRTVLLRGLIERLHPGAPADDPIECSTHLFGDRMLPHPDGARRLLDTHVDAAARSVCWTFAPRPDLRLTRTLTLSTDDDAHPVARLVYTLHALPDLPESDLPCSFEARPFTPLCDFHALERRGAVNPCRALATPHGWRIERGEVLLELRALRADEADPPATIDADEAWWHDFVYPHETARGQDDREDLLSPGVLRWTFSSARLRAASEVRPLRFAFEAVLLAPDSARVPAALQPLLRATGKQAVDDDTRDDSPRALLDRAAAQFIVVRAPSAANPRAGWSILAGYPWFSDWGRDAMIALPGLLLLPARGEDEAAARRRLTIARETLLTFARAMHQGLIPNRFADDAGPPEYNTVDASLWFIHAVWSCARASAARFPSEEREHAEAMHELIAGCRTIVRAYRQGTLHGIGVARDGLVTAGNETTQLTWMDAARDGVVFTPRHGKAVEINALWHHGLRCLADLTDDPHERDELRERAGQVAIAFQMNFWWAERACLHDVLTLTPVVTRRRASGGLRLSRDEEEAAREPDVESFDWLPDFRVRPNQIFAASLHHSPLTPDQRAAVTRAVERELLTPFGLRTLARQDADYRGRYEGSLFERDAGYHNGTVWPWLIGAFIEARLRAAAFSMEARRDARRLLEPLLNELTTIEPLRCAGQLAEVYDGDPPHRPSGCPAQAWSVAEVRRALALIDNGPSAE